MDELLNLKHAIKPIIAELDNLRYELIDLIEQNVIKGSSALKPIAMLVQIQIVNLTTFPSQMSNLIQ